MKSIQLSVLGAGLAAVASAVPTLQRKTYPEYVTSEALQDLITMEALMDKGHHLEDIAYDTPERNRVIGSPGHQGTVDWIYDSLDELDYYDVVRQPFVALVQTVGEGNVTVKGEVLEAALMEYSPGGQVTAPIVAVANIGCEPADYPASLSGNIALISRGTCQFGFKSALAGAAGAVGAIIYNNVPGELGSVTLGPPPRPEGPYVPSFGTSQETGLSLLEQISSGNVTATIDAFSIINNITTYNVLAQTKGGDPDNVLALGAHTDSVDAGPGINDDGSGTIGCLETAIQLAKFKTVNAVRFGFWAGEEEGLLGSTHYVETLSEEEIAKIKLYLNFDMIASPNYIYGIYDGDGSSFNLSGPQGSAQAEYFFETFMNGKGVNFTATEFSGRSDYGPFLDAGIASGGLFTGAEENKTAEWAAQFGGTAGLALDPNYHGPGDNYTNLDFDAFLINTKGIAASVATYSFSFDSLHQTNATTVPAPMKKVKRSETAKKNDVRSQFDFNARTHRSRKRLTDPRSKKTRHVKKRV
ncbi:Zn-dependent exopeptidase [Aulographum hederae CBS 113979]|uniref:Peptide hydrolase n=1 Tax=Aulographum hederae CBS 113979 TaxID=1176131 RepID=A0A6G1GN61_9PEZI|nr:Zn-dependent exopeptidase [Aulographum hederae CBS 113979]